MNNYIPSTTLFIKMYDATLGKIFPRKQHLSLDDLVGNNKNKELTAELIAEACNSSYLNKDGAQIPCFPPRRHNETTTKTYY